MISSLKQRKVEFKPGIKLNRNIYSYFERVLKKKKMLETIPMGHDQYTVPDTVWLSNLLLLLSFSNRKHTSMASRAILSKFFEEK